METVDGVWLAYRRELPRFGVEELGEPFQGGLEAMGGGAEAEAEMGRHAETIAGHDEDAAGGQSLAEVAAIGEAGEPWHGSHAAAGTHPAQ